MLRLGRTRDDLYVARPGWLCLIPSSVARTHGTCGQGQLDLEDQIRELWDVYIENVMPTWPQSASRDSRTTSRVSILNLGFVFDDSR